MATFKLLPSTPMQWKIFFLGLLLGFCWGGLSVLFGQYVLRIPEYAADSHFYLPTWIVAKYFVPVGMAFGVAFSSLYFLHNTRVMNTFLSIGKVFRHGMASILIGLVCTLVAGLLATLILIVLQRSGSGELLVIPIIMIISIPAMLVSIIPVGLLTQPLITLIWQKWYGV